MKNHPLPERSFLRSMLDAIPSLIFVVDEDIRIMEFNAAAAELLSSDREKALRQRSGEVLHCIHSNESAEGCDHTSYCRECVIRNSVDKAFHGQRIVRKITRLELVNDDQKEEFYAWITASPFRYNDELLVLLLIEDIDELIRLRRLIPICAKCKKIREDDQYWVQAESYFKRHLDLDFSHGYCPECLQAFLGEIEANRR